MTAVLAHQAGRSVITLSLNIPGPDKNLPGCETLFARAGAALEDALGGAVVAGG
ncbi:MAG: hypothetical protein EHM24_00825, partial [Acidobacteria bacterium]